MVNRKMMPLRLLRKLHSNIVTFKRWHRVHWKQQKPWPPDLIYPKRSAHTKRCWIAQRSMRFIFRCRITCMFPGRSRRLRPANMFFAKSQSPCRQLKHKHCWTRAKSIPGLKSWRLLCIGTTRSGRRRESGSSQGKSGSCGRSNRFFLL
jgi:hypothetical protein